MNNTEELNNKDDVDCTETYPDYFFKLAGATNGLGLEEPEDLPPTAEDFSL